MKKLLAVLILLSCSDNQIQSLDLVTVRVEYRAEKMQSVYIWHNAEHGIKTVDLGYFGNNWPQPVVYQWQTGFEKGLEMLAGSKTRFLQPGSVEMKLFVNGVLVDSQRHEKQESEWIQDIVLKAKI